MRQTTIISLIIAVVSMTGSVNNTPFPTESPKEVIQKYWKFETAGGMLTPDGWDSAATFFVKLGRPPLTRRISVIAGNYAVSDAVINGDSAEVMVEILPQGQVNSELKFTPSADQKEGLSFHLILTSKYSSPGASGEAPVERTGPPEWRIIGTGTTNWLDPGAAIRYVTDMKTKSADSTIKKNADRTLSVLARWH